LGKTQQPGNGFGVNEIVDVDFASHRSSLHELTPNYKKWYTGVDTEVAPAVR
jgi:hypothetical protein